MYKFPAKPWGFQQIYPARNLWIVWKKMANQPAEISAKSVLQLKPWRLNQRVDLRSWSSDFARMSPTNDRRIFTKNMDGLTARRPQSFERSKVFDERYRIYKSTEYGCFVGWCQLMHFIWIANSLGVGIINYEVNILCNILLRPSRLWMMVDILWMEEILHQLVDGLSHCNPIIYSVL